MNSSLSDDPCLARILELQRALLDSARAWSEGADDETHTDQLRSEALELQHQRYVQRIPAYRHLAEQSDASGKCDLSTLVNTMMFTTDLFKSYDQGLLESQDFSELTGWLSGICAEQLPVQARSVSNLDEWIKSLAENGIRLSYSSGTSGMMSFVPRDPLTWRSLCRNSSVCGNDRWYHTADGKKRDFDCLVAAPRGDGTGIQGVANGLAAMAARTHYVDSTVTVTASNLQEIGRSHAPSVASNSQRDTLALVDFVNAGREAGRPLLVFGPPFQLRRLCERVQAHCGSLATHADSVVVTGGGWKSFQGDRISHDELRDRIEVAFGIGPEKFSDAYSTTELNCALTCCGELRYHIPPLLEVVVLDEAFCGEPRRPGRGYIGFLDPFALSYPGFVIPGDVAQLEHGDCKCGLRGWFLRGPIQRAPNSETRGCGGVMASLLA
ncbi:MAG: hypothetical protein AB8B91_21670 [Rubripirellula sp.]